MSTISTIISDVQYSRQTLLETIAPLSERELTEVPLYEGWTVKDVLAHILAWDERTVNILPLIRADRADEVAGVEVEQHNQRAVTRWRERPLAELLAEMDRVHLDICQRLGEMTVFDIDMRHERKGRVITIRSYIIDIMTEHERQHTYDIEKWRQAREAAIDPVALVGQLQANRSRFWGVVESMPPAKVNDPAAVGTWSVRDVVGHLAEWERLMLQAAYHIYDPSEPQAEPVAGPEADWNAVLAARHTTTGWAQVKQHLRRTQASVDAFLDNLTPGDWKLRGPYPWPDDHGTLAELVSHIAEHYADHLPALRAWQHQP